MKDKEYKLYTSSAGDRPPFFDQRPPKEILAEIKEQENTFYRIDGKELRNLLQDSFELRSEYINFTQSIEELVEEKMEYYDKECKINESN